MVIDWVWFVCIIIILAIFCIGLGFIVDWLLKRVRLLEKPRIPIEDKELNDLGLKIRHLDLEERLIVMRMLLGSCKVVCDVNSSEIVISAAQAMVSQADDSKELLEEYTG